MKQSQPRHVTLPKRSVINEKAVYNERADCSFVASLTVAAPVLKRLSSCSSSSSDWTTGVFDPSSLEAWLSQVELEEVDNIRIWSHKGQKSSRTRHFSSIHPLLCQCGQELEKKWLFNLLRQNSSLRHFNYKCRISELHGFNIQWVDCFLWHFYEKCLTLRGFLLQPKSEKVGTVWKTQIKKESSDFYITWLVFHCRQYEHKIFHVFVWSTSCHL